MKFVEREKAGVVEFYAFVKSCERKSAKNGTFYLDMVLADKDGELVAKLWDFKGDILPEVNSVMKFLGTLQQYNGNDQFIIQKMRPTVESDNINMSDYVKSADYTGNSMLDEVISIVNGFNDAELKSVVLSMLEDNKEQLLFFPAAGRCRTQFFGHIR